MNLGNIQIEKNDAEELIVASLLHDVGHGPFSHATEEIIELYTNRRHDYVKDILLNNEIKDILIDHSLNPISIANHISGNTLLSQILCSEIDLDKVDYLKRDMYYTGISSYNINCTRLLKNINFINNKLVLSIKSIKDAESLLISRNHMNYCVYYHHISRISETMCSRACVDILENKIITPKEFSFMDDISLLSLLRERSINDKNSVAGKLSARLNYRNLYKRAIYRNINTIKDKNIISHIKKNIIKVENELAIMSGLDYGDVLIDIPKNPKKIVFKSVIKENLKPLTEVSTIINTLFQDKNENFMFGVFTSIENINKVRKIASDYFDLNI